MTFNTLDIPRQHMQKIHKIKDENVYKDWRDLVKREKFADAVVIATQDRDHIEPTIELARLKYHILLEKPMSISEDGCKRITNSIKENNLFFAVGHVLRYSPMTRTVKMLINHDVIGKILNIQHVEPVGWFHFAHSYVRGNWRNEQSSSFMLMTKSCHDIDWIHHIIGERCLKINSFGSLSYFNKKNKPKNSGSKCLDCRVERDCCYSAKKIYLEESIKGNPILPILAPGVIPDIENITYALDTTNYGSCVYDLDNDVVDNQVVMMEFESGATATITVISTSKDMCVRKSRIYGSKGELEIDGRIIHHFDYNSRKMTKIDPESEQPLNSNMIGHEGSDWHLMNSFVTAIERNDSSFILSGVEETLTSHLLVFEAEKKRKENQ